jgi:hypothetical protein
MYYSVVCAEDADFRAEDAPLQGVRPHIAAGREQELQQYLDSCTLWRVDELDAAVDEPLRSEIPTLLLSGRYDPITPPTFATAVAARLPNSHVIVAGEGAHGVAFRDPCMNEVIRRFLNDPMREPPHDCLSTAPVAEFTPPNAIMLALMGRISSLDRRLLMQALLGAGLLLVVFSVLPVRFFSFLIRALRNVPQSPEPAPPQAAMERRLRRSGDLLAIGFATLATVFAVSLAIAIGLALFEPRYASALSIPGSAWPLFLIPPLLILIAAGMVVVSLAQWRQGVLSPSGRLYYSLVTLCAIGCLILLGIQGVLFPLLA